MSSICEYCGETLIPAPARFDGEATFVGYMPHTCKTIKQDERQKEDGEQDELWNEVGAILYEAQSFKIYKHILAELKSKFHITKK